MLYYKSPMYCLVIVGIIILFFLYSRYRKSSKDGNAQRSFIFRKGGASQNSNQVNELATLFMVQQMFNESDHQDVYNAINSEENDKSSKIDAVKNEILDLLLED